MTLATVRARVADQDELRMVALPVAYRAADGDTPPRLEGYAAMFDTWTQIGDGSWGFMESIAPGAFARSLGEDDIRACFNHDANFVLGRTSAKTATFTEDAKGLRAVILPPDTMCGRDVVSLIQRGDVTGMSFMFHVRKDEWTEGEDGELPTRRLLDVKLYEAGPVTFPAYEETSIAARDRATAMREARRVAVPDPDVLARRRQADRLAFELAVAAIEL